VLLLEVNIPINYRHLNSKKELKLKKQILLHMSLIFVASLMITPVLFAQSISFDAGQQVPADEPAEGTVVRVAHSETLNLTEELTIEAWIYPTAIDAAGGRSFISGKADTFMNALSVADTSYQSAINAAQWTWEGSGSVDTNEWTHVATSFDGAVYELHVNGTHRDTIEDPGAINTSLADFLVGWLPQWGEAFTGQIDEVRVSNVARYPASNIDVPTTEFSPDGDTVALYHFNEGSGEETADASGNENNGILEGGAEWAADGAPLAGGTAVEPSDKLATSWAAVKRQY